MPPAARVVDQRFEIILEIGFVVAQFDDPACDARKPVDQRLRIDKAGQRAEIIIGFGG
ncbi:hypothetical protein D3C83_308170 [compost metagenome]